MVDVVVIHSIPQASLLLIPGVPEKDRATLRKELEDAAGHKNFAIVWPSGDAGPVGIAAGDDFTNVLRAVIGDDARDDLIGQARKAAADEANRVVDVRTNPKQPPTPTKPTPTRTPPSK